MSNHHLRKEQHCANCGHVVAQRFCPNCGQENTETRQSFGHLVRHFFEDITHYDGAFWRTIKLLLLRPALLTKEFLAGKRNSYVPPVRLYIFISFVTFLLPHLLPESDTRERIQNDAASVLKTNLTGFDSITAFHVGGQAYHSVHEFDSVQQSLPEQQRLDWATYKLSRKALEVQEKRKTGTELRNEISEHFSKNFPKALFIYLPIFALIVWLFHSKRRWLFFDHAIFTIHYFAFVMLLSSMRTLMIWPFEYFGSSQVILVAGGTLRAIFFPWIIYYFFRAHHKMYEERRFVSALKAWPIFLINAILLLLLIGALAFYAFYSLH